MHEYLVNFDPFCEILENRGHRISDLVTAARSFGYSAALAATDTEGPSSPESRLDDASDETKDSSDPFIDELNDDTPTGRVVREIVGLLARDLEEGLRFMTRLPPNLEGFEVLTKIFDSGFLDSFNIESAEVAREHLQFVLRTIEAWFSEASRLSCDSNYDPGDTAPPSMDDIDRILQVLTVYLKHIIIHGFLPVDMVLLDLQEITVRYIWATSVRGFKEWLEGSFLMGVEAP
jgi:hypothetical protein